MRKYFCKAVLTLEEIALSDRSFRPRPLVRLMNGVKMKKCVGLLWNYTDRFNGDPKRNWY